MTFLSRAFVNSIFKKLALKDRVPFRLFLYNSLWLGFCVLFLYQFADFIVGILFGEAYLQVSKYIFLLSIAFFLQGMYAPFSFLAVKSKGKELRNVAYLEAIISVAGNVILVPIYFVEGAIYASMTGSGSTVFGLYKKRPTSSFKYFEEIYQF